MYGRVGMAAPLSPLLPGAAAPAALTAIAPLSAVVRRSCRGSHLLAVDRGDVDLQAVAQPVGAVGDDTLAGFQAALEDRKSTRLNSRHPSSSYTVFYLQNNTGP